MGSATSKVVVEGSAKSEEVFRVRNELQEQLEVTKKELKIHVVAAVKKELQEHLKATKEELKKQSEATKKELSNQLVTAKEEMKKQSEKVSGEKAELEKQLEYARKAALVLMDAADAYQEAAEKKIKAKMEELEGTRKAALVFMEAADTYQEAKEREIKAQTEDLENTRKAALVFMDAADTYQEAAEKKLKATGLEFLESEFSATLLDNNNQEIMEVDVTVKNRECDLVKVENDMFQSEVLATDQPKPKPNLFEAAVETKRLKMELGALVEAKEAGADAFEAEMEADIMKEPKDLLKSKVEETKTMKGLMMHENEMLWSEDFIAEQKYDTPMYEVEVESTEMQLNVLTEAKEAAATGFNVEEAKIMKELEGIHAIRDAHQAEKLRAESKVQHVSMLQLQPSYDELDVKCSDMNDEKNSVQEAQDPEKAKASCRLKPKPKIQGTGGLQC